MSKNVGDLGEISVPDGFKKLPKVQKIAQSGHTASNPTYLPRYMTDRGESYYSPPNMCVRGRGELKTKLFLMNYAFAFCCIETILRERHPVERQDQCDPKKIAKCL